MSDNKRTKTNKIGSGIIGGALCIIFIGVTIFCWQNALVNGAAAMRDGFDSSYLSAKEKTYDKIYQTFFDAAEKEFHVSNTVSIYIGELSEEQKLEVLKVSDVEYIITNDDTNSWLEVPGEGTFVVDLKGAEFIVDNARLHVLARVPEPELTNITIDYGGVNKLLFTKEGFLNGTYQEGEELARTQLAQADILLRREFMSNANFYNNAKKAAISAVKLLVQQLNPDVDGLSVDVEFI